MDKLTTKNRPNNGNWIRNDEEKANTFSRQFGFVFKSPPMENSPLEKYPFHQLLDGPNLIDQQIFQGHRKQSCNLQDVQNHIIVKPTKH